GVTGQGDTVGSVSQIRHWLISVETLATGAACDVDNQCSDGLSCLCKSGSGCAALALAPSTNGGDAGLTPDAGRTSPPVCLADCSGGDACAPGFVCQQ